MYKTSDISKILNLSPSTIKFYDNRGIISAKRMKNNYRVYTNMDIIKIISYETYRLLGYSLNDASRLSKYLSLDEYENMVKDKLTELYFQKDMILRKIEYLERAKFNIETYMKLQTTIDKYEYIECENMMFLPIQSNSNKINYVIDSNLTWYSFEYSMNDKSIVWGISIVESHLDDNQKNDFIKHECTKCLHTITILKNFNDLKDLLDDLYSKNTNLGNLVIGCVLNNINEEELLLEIFIPLV